MRYDDAGLLVTVQLTSVSDLGLFSGGAKAHTEETESESLRCVVRNLRTTSCKISGRNAAIRAFAPLNESCEMTAAFSAGCNTKHFNFTTRLCMMIHPDTSI